MIKKFNMFCESLNTKKFKELEFDEDMMSKTTVLFSLIDCGIRKDFEVNIIKISDVISETLTPKTFNKLFGDNPINKPFDIINIFTTSVLTETIMKDMFDNVVVHEGADDEEEFVSALEINNKVVLLLHSPNRGSQIRIQDNNYTLPIDELLNIIKTICEIYNTKY